MGGRGLAGAGAGMPRKIRQLKAGLRRAGFAELPDRGKGDHALWRHTEFPEFTVGLDGKDGADAKRYMERDARDKIAAVERKRQEEGGE